MHKDITYSVIIPIYNREKYLKDAIESVIHQTYGLKQIQLVLVDDGSTDGSGEICDYYKEKYPNQCDVIHQENQGPSRARKNGVRLAKGKWINFLDSDDKFSRNTFFEVAKFIKRHGKQTDVVAIPVYYFGAKKGEHPLNYKFHEGNRVVDLSEDWKNPQLFINSAFMKAEVLKKVAFNDDINLPASEDAREMLKILLEKQTIGFVNTTRYWYRQHSNSLIVTAKEKKGWYLDILRDFSIYILDYAKEKLGEVPKFVQNTVMYEMQWRLFQKRIPHGLLNDVEQEQYKSTIFDICNRIDADVICSQRRMWREQKTFLMHRKVNDYPHLTDDGENEAYFEYGNTRLGFAISEMPLRLSFATVSDNVLTIEGWIPHYLYETREKLKLYVDINGKKKELETKERITESQFLGEIIYKKYVFYFSVPIEDEKCIISFWVEYGGRQYELNKIVTEKFFPLDPYSRFSYKKYSTFILRRNKGRLLACKKKYCLFNETLYLLHLLKKRQRGTKKTFLVRLFYDFIHLFPHKEIWMISDRIMKADDNGEALFKYLVKKKEIKPYFVISKESEDYSRLKKIGPVVNFFSIRHRILYLLSTYNISSQGEEIIIRPFHGYQYGYRSLDLPRFVFLQHGVTKDDVSVWLNRWNKNIYGFITTGIKEYESIIHGDYGYQKKNVWLTGFCRYDYLENKDARTILIMPTWRKYLLGNMDPNTGMHSLNKNFTSSVFFRFYNSLINDEKMFRALRDNGYILKLILHPLLAPYVYLFDLREEVIISSENDTYQKLFAEGSLLVTDYSSTAFDFAYLNKPVVYCQFDKDVFFGGNHTYKKGYFDYEEDGFGEVEYTLEATVDRIIEYVQNDCKLKSKYQKRIDKTFAFHDKNNCERVYQKLLEMKSEM